MDQTVKNQNIEIDLLLEAIYLKYGYDFRGYARASVRRRVLQQLSKSQLGTVSEMIHQLLYDQQYFETLLVDLTVNVTEMFRDPAFFKAQREAVIPRLRKRPSLKIWHAGCSSGEEVYSMAILLQEEGLYKNARIFATDANEAVLKKAQKGVFDANRMKTYTRNYMKAGGLEAFSDYYTSRYGLAMMKNVLKENIVFSHHNLVTDGVFGEMDMILCRNVLIYFNRELQERVFNLFWESLGPGGFLCLGTAETIRFSKHSDDFENMVENEKIFRKKGVMIPEDRDYASNR